MTPLTDNSIYSTNPTARVRIEAIRDAWNLFTQQMGTWILAQLAFAGVMLFGMIALGILMSLIASGESTAIPIILTIILALLMGFGALFLSGGLYRMAIKQVKGEVIRVGDIFSVTDVLPQLLGTYILIGISVTIASMFLVIPGYIVGGLLMLAIPLVVDKRCGVMEALTKSWNALKSEWAMAGIFYFVVSCLPSIGAILLIVGMLLTFPLYFLATAVLYRDFFLNTTHSLANNYPIAPNPYK